MITPGPSHILMAANSLRVGLPKSFATAIGDLTANAMQMLAAAFGIGALVTRYPSLVDIIKWLGVAYIVWLGIQKIRTASTHKSLSESASLDTINVLWRQGFMTSMSNPKAIIFFAALFPQFISIDSPQGRQWFILATTYIVIDGAFLSVYGLMASGLSKRLDSTNEERINILAGISLIIVAIVLIFS